MEPNCRELRVTGSEGRGAGIYPRLLSGLLAIGFLLCALSTRADAQWTLTGSNITDTPTNSNVGIGLTNPLATLHVVAQANPGFFFDGYGSTPNMQFRWANGTASSPTPVKGGDVLGIVGFRGYVSGTGFTSIASSNIRAIASEDWSSSAQGSYISFQTILSGTVTQAERMRIDGTGFVGIGTTTPTAPLDVNGNAIVTGTFTSGSISSSGNITAANGTISGHQVLATYQDVAEWVPAATALPAGTVVVLDRSHQNQVKASTKSYDTSVAGVISARPGVALGQEGEGKLLVATTGRVRVRVDASAGPIEIGDLLVTSDKPGFAMKSQPVEIGGTQIHRPGTLIGKALEPLKTGTGEILVLLSLQ